MSGRALLACVIVALALFVGGRAIAQVSPAPAEISIYAMAPDIRPMTDAENARVLALFNAANATSSDPAAKAAAFREMVQLREVTSGPDHPLTASTLGLLASTVWLDQKNPAGAEPLYRRALQIQQRRLGPDHIETLDTERSLGQLLGQVGRHAEAEATLRPAVSGYRKRTDSISSMRWAADLLADQITAQGRFAEAEPLYKEALAVAEAHPGDTFNDLALALDSYAQNLDQQGRYREGEALLRRVVAIREAHSGVQSGDTAGAYNRLGINLAAQARLEDAGAAYRRAYDINVANLPADAPVIAANLGNMGVNLLDRGRPVDAEPLLRRAIAIWIAKEGEQNIDTIYAERNLSGTLVALGKGDEGEALARRALVNSLSLWGEQNLESIVSMAKVGEVLSSLGRYAEAETFHRRAVAAAAALTGPDSVLVADQTCALGDVALNQYRLGEAETAFRRCWSIREARLGVDHPSTAAAIEKVAMSLFNQHRAPDAEALMRRALAIMQAHYGAQSWQVGEAKAILATVLLLQRRNDEAGRLFTESAAAAEQQRGPESPELAATLMLAGIQLGLAGQRDLAVADLRRALAINEKVLGADNPMTFNARSYLGLTLVNAGKAGEATPLLIQALADADRVSGQTTGDALAGNLASAWLAQDRYEEALAAARRALRATGRAAATTVADVRQAAPGALGHEEGQASAFQVVRAAWGLAQQQPAGADALRAEAFAAAQSFKTSSSSQALAEGAARVAAERAGAGAQVKIWRDLQDRIGAIDAAIARLSQQGSAGDAARQALVRERETTTADLGRAEKAIGDTFPRFFDLLRSPPVTVAELQTNAKLLRADEALILLTPGSDVFGANTGIVFVVTREKAVWAEMGLGRDQLRNQIAGLHAALASPISTRAFGVAPDRDNIRYDRAAAFGLYQALFGNPDVRAVLEGKSRWLLAPQGMLLSLPFAALVTAPPPGGAAGDSDPASLRATSWLGLTKTLVVLPSVSSLRVQRLYAATTAAGARTPFFGIGDPAFSGRPDPPVAIGGNRSVPLSNRAARAYFRSGVADLATLATLPRLEGTAREISLLARNLGAGPDSYLLQTAATEAELRRRSQNGSLESADIVAFATHGIMAGEMQADIAEPALALTPPLVPPGANASPDNDGLLTASEAATLNLSAQWVILSACNTAAGGDPDAESLTGLARAFLFAGAQSLLVSHYPVLDSAAMQLTTEAAKAARDQHLARPEALRAAMAALFAKTDQDAGGASFAHPTAWAPFVIIDPN